MLEENCLKKSNEFYNTYHDSKMVIMTCKIENSRRVRGHIVCMTRTGTAKTNRIIKPLYTKTTINGEKQRHLEHEYKTISTTTL